MSNLTIVALLAAEGTAIVKSEQGYRLVRPPYTLKDCPFVGEAAVEIAVLQENFVVKSQDVPNWPSLINYLIAQVITFREASGKGLPGPDVATELVELAPIEIIDSFLERIEKQLIPSQALDHAENLLIAILRSKAVSSNWDRMLRAVELLEKIKAVRQNSIRVMTRIVDTGVAAENIRASGDLPLIEYIADKIRNRGSIFDFA